MQNIIAWIKADWAKSYRIKKENMLIDDLLHICSGLVGAIIMFSIMTNGVL